MQTRQHLGRIEVPDRVPVMERAIGVELITGQPLDSLPVNTILTAVPLLL
jgi:hypothetical protein